MFWTPKKKIITHNSRFHADDVFAVATLSLVFGGNITVMRTRDPKKYVWADIILDIGGEYDPARDRFDHHQTGRAGFHDNGIPYASFGLVWKKYGEKAAGTKTLADDIEKNLVCPIDANDNGVSIYDVKADFDFSPVTIQSIIASAGNTYKEKDRDQDAAFMEMVAFAKAIILRAVAQSVAHADAQEKIDAAYAVTDNKKVLILDDNYPWDSKVQKYPDLLFVIHPNQSRDSWVVNTVRIDPKEYAPRKKFPASWGGLRNEELAKVTGVADSSFCHTGLFVASAKSLEGAKKLADLALKAD